MYQLYYLRNLRPKWATFYAAWHQSEASKKQIGDQRYLLQARLGGFDRGALVLSLDNFLKGDEAGRETKDCLGAMQQFWELSVHNTTTDYKWSSNTPIELAFLAARQAMRDYQLVIVSRQYDAAVKKNKATAKALAKQTKPDINKRLAEMRRMLELED